MKIIQKGLRDIIRPNSLPHTLNVGLTGSIGSGKSTIAKILQRHGASVVDFDAISRSLTTQQGGAIDSIRTEFGDGMIDADGALNRVYMRDLIFQNPAAKAKLELIMHRLISAEAVEQAQQLAISKPLALIYDIPLLYGNRFWLEQLDLIVVVICDYETQMARVLERNHNYNRHTVDAILKTQANNAQLLEIASIIIDNTKSQANILQGYTQVNILVEYLKHLCEKPPRQNNL